MFSATFFEFDAIWHNPQERECWYHHQFLDYSIKKGYLPNMDWICDINFLNFKPESYRLCLLPSSGLKRRAFLASSVTMTFLVSLELMDLPLLVQASNLIHPPKTIISKCYFLDHESLNKVSFDWFKWMEQNYFLYLTQNFAKVWCLAASCLRRYTASLLPYGKM